VSALLLQEATQSWTLVSALIAALGVLAGVIGLLWRAYTTAQGKYERRLEANATDLVPVIVELGAQAKAMHRSAERLLEAAINLEQRRNGDASSP
jgi:hypothetical protein